jgi:hypothetical protein
MTTRFTAADDHESRQFSDGSRAIMDRRFPTDRFLRMRNGFLFPATGGFRFQARGDTGGGSLFLPFAAAAFSSRLGGRSSDGHRGARKARVLGRRGQLRL